jgi:hypothetical protein
MQLIKGQFNSSDALELITQMIHVKIKYHETKINNLSNEEDIKNREAKIIQLQKDLFEAKKYILSKTSILELESTIVIN